MEGTRDLEELSRSYEASPNSDSDSDEVSDAFHQIMSLNSVTCDSKIEEDTFPESRGVDIKINPLQLMKIDVNRFDDTKSYESNNLHKADSIIKQLVRQRHQSGEDAIERPIKKSGIGSIKVSIPFNAEGIYRKEIHLKPDIQRELSRQRNPFRLKCFLFRRFGYTALTTKFMELATAQSQAVLRGNEQIVDSFLLFFYRNVLHKKRRSGKKLYIPDMYVLSKGFARKLVVKFVEKNFTKKIERRLLQFPFHQVEYIKESSPVGKRTDLARSGQYILFDVWDFLDNIVGNRTRQLRDNSSLYSEGLGAFCSQTGEPLPVKFDVKEKSLTIRKSLTILQMGSTLMHFFKISSGRKTFRYSTLESTPEEEIDTPEFKMHDFHRKVTSPKLREDLNKELYKVMERCLKGYEKTFVYLTNKDIKWNKAEQMILKVRKPNKQMLSKVKYWPQPPTLDEVLECLQDVYETCEFDPEWLNDVKLEFDKKSKSLKEFIFRRLDFGEIGTYIYYFGTWLEITAHYLFLIEKDFTQLLADKFIDASEIPLMPWKVIQGDKTGVRSSKRSYSVPSFNLNETKRHWKQHFETFCKRCEFKDVKDVVVRKLVELDNAGKVKEGNYLALTDRIVKMQTCSVAARLYLLHECRLMEVDYNASHALLNSLLPDCITLITCDRQEPHGIEPCDILIWKGNTTYLVHVKSGFTGSAIREVSSQIRNAADHIYRNQTSTKETGIIRAFWEAITSESSNGFHQLVAKNIVQAMGYERFRHLFDIKRNIIFVLACRDARKQDFKEDVETQVHRCIMVNMEDEIEKKLQVDDPSEVIQQLKKEGYLTKSGYLTNKFILDGKDNKTKFVETIKQWDGVGRRKTAQDLFDILTSGLSKSKSTIAKMEIIRLCRDFQQYNDVNKRFQLKITSIDRHYRTSYDNHYLSAET